MNADDVILAALEAAYELSTDEIIQAVRLRCDNECEIPAKLVVDVIEQLMKDGWLVHEMRNSVSHYRRRTEAQWQALKAASNPSQGVLL